MTLGNNNVKVRNDQAKISNSNLLRNQINPSQTGDLNASLSVAQFEASYKTLKAPGDGHCFIHALEYSFKSMGILSYTYDYLLNSLAKETLISNQHYLPFINDMSMCNLRKGLYDYIYHKKYNTGFGDLVPVIMANALNYAILIISQCTDSYSVQTILPRNNSPSCMRVTVVKSGEHYDGILKISHITCQDTDKPESVQIADNPSSGQYKHGLGSPTRNHVQASIGNADQSQIISKPLRMMAWNINGLNNHKLSDDI